MTEEIIIDGVDVAGCFNLDEWKHCNICQELIKTIPNRHQCLIEEELRCEFYTNCYYKQLKRLEQENEELSKLIRGTKDYAEVCSVCKDEVTIYPNISGRTDYTQNEVECRALAQIITRKNNLEQENKELKKACEKCKLFDIEKTNRNLLERIEKLEQENKELKDNNNHLQVIIDDGRAENKRFREENRELKAYKDVNENFKKAWDELNKKYTEVLKLAKENADSNEYCLQELEKENKELKKDVQLFKCLDTFGENECHCACRCLGNEFCEDADKKINSYRSALEEIRVIADDTFKVCDDDCGNARKIKLIIDKINEVLNHSEG
jgi:chromosome segregation ATPase